MLPPPKPPPELKGKLNCPCILDNTRALPLVKVRLPNWARLSDGLRSSPPRRRTTADHATREP
jgi:hypothetical protein